MISQLLNRQNTTYASEIPQPPSMVLKLRRKLYLCLKSQKMKVVTIILFINLSITVGVLTVCLTKPKPNETCELTFQRKMTGSLISSSQPRSVAVGDLNNDYQMDIVVPNSGTDAIGIFLAQGNGTFAKQQTHPTGSGSCPYSVAVSDFNNDTYLDIVVANYGTNSIGIFLGNGDGTFTDENLVSLGSSRPLFVTVDDFNNDHRMDLVVVNYGTSNIGILLGNGSGYFQNQTTYSTGYDSLPCSLAVGDFNKDNQLDIAVANCGTDNVGIFFGYGNGTFASQQTYTTLPKSNPSSIAVGDFNNDNQLDIVVANNGATNIGILLGHGNGFFPVQIIYSLSSNSHLQYITVGDMNKDNQSDIVVVDSINDYIYILLGYGNGSFATLTTYDTTSDSSPFWAAVTDLNKNNQSDIVIAHYGTNNVLVLIDYFIKPSARKKNYHVASREHLFSVAASDFNNDHILDIVTAGGDSIYILMGLGNGTFGKETAYMAGNISFPRYICVGDLNNDNQTDIVTANKGSDSVGVFLGNGDGTFTTTTTYSTGIDSHPRWVTLGDVNNDNVLDIISANTDSDTVGILLGNGDGTFAAMVNYSTGMGSDPHSVAVGYINHDNYLDLVVVHVNEYIVIFFGYGNGSFIIQTSFSTGQYSSIYTVAVADFNMDNHLDIVVANIFADNVGVFLGYGNGSFTTQTPYFTGPTSNPYYVIIADFNNDNMSDIVATNLGTNEVVIFYGFGNGSFELARRYSTGFGSKPIGIIAADLDNNKQLEIVVTLPGGLGNFAILTEYVAAEFVNQTKYSTGSAFQPYSVAISDFSNNNRSDIVVANSGNGSLSIFVGSNNKTFGTVIIYPIGIDSYPQYVITCDINKDNQSDIVSANSKANSISVIVGYGNGTFAEQLIYSTEEYSNPSSVASGDFNNDTHMDLVIANEGTDSIGILYGFNYTSFYDQVTYSSIDSLGPFDVVVSDFNNDNYLDIAATFSDNGKIGILLGYGNGSFMAMMIYSTGNGSKPWGIAVGDFNNDNQTDIVVTNSDTNTIGVFLGYGNGSFAAIMTYSTGNHSRPIAVAVGDFNNDDRLDIVVANRDANNVGVFLGYSNGSFSIVQPYSTGQGSVPYSVTVGDFNNDGRLDIAVANYDTDTVGIRLGYGNGTFRDQKTLSVDYSINPLWITVGDFNSDSQLDIATTNYDGHNVGIFLGYGNGTFSSVNYYSTGTGSQPRCVTIGDFNNDNITDIAVANDGANTIVVLFGIGDGSFLLGKPYPTDIASQPYALAIGDFNNDSRLDIAVANSYANNIGIFLGYSNEPFASMTTYIIGEASHPHSVAVSDLNNDGSSDIIVANYGADTVGILLGHSNGVFDPMTTYPTGNGSAPHTVAVADFNGDHYLDIVVTNSETNDIAILLGYGNGTFAVRTKYSTGADSHPYTVAIADFNNDNRSDIAVANSGTNNIFLLYGYGNGTFGNDIFYFLGYGDHPYSIAVKDLNQDDWIDIVIVCHDTDHLEFLIKMC